jgi:Tol biopolymer transport system component
MSLANREVAMSYNRIIMPAICVFLMAMVAFSGCSNPIQNSTPTATSSSSGKIAYIAYHSHSENIYTMNADGSHKRRLTSDTDPFVRINDLCWSPDGKKISFSVYLVKYPETTFYVMNADGSNLTELTRGPAVTWLPDGTQIGNGTSSLAWSPDGTRIVYELGGQIYIMNADGSNSEPLHIQGDTYAPYFIRWSPDGAQIAFSADHDGTSQIFTMDIDGGNLKMLTHNPDSNSFRLSWSPDSTKIAYQCESAGGSGIWVMRSDGSNQVQLTQNPIVNSFTGDDYPTWSPDGKKIAFQRPFESYILLRDKGIHTAIFTMNVDGSDIAQLTHLPILRWSSVSYQRPVWSPR